MPRRSLHNPDADNRPAFGLRDDAHDEVLRDETASLEARKQLQEAAKRQRRVKPLEDFFDIDDDDAERILREEHKARRTSHDWRASNRVTSSEVAAIFGAELLRFRETTSNVKAFLAGHELTRDEQPFDVQEFLAEKLGFLPKARRKREWQGNYSLPGIRHKLVLGLDTHGPRIVVNLRGRQRLTVYFAGGRIKSEGEAEAGILRDLIARAIRSKHRSIPNSSTVWDIWAVCVPRSEHFRKAILADQKKPRELLEYRPHCFMVERISAKVIGLEEAFTYDD